MDQPLHDADKIDVLLCRLREEYWQGLTPEEPAAGELLECLVFTLGGESYAFETRFAGEVIRIPRLVRVPAVSSLVAGVFNLRGEIAAAMDVRPLLGLTLPEIGPAGRILVVKGAQFTTGLLVEAALGVRNFHPGRLEASGAPPDGGDRPFLLGRFRDDEPINLLDLEALLASPGLLIGVQ